METLSLSHLPHRPIQGCTSVVLRMRVVQIASAGTSLSGTPVSTQQSKQWNIDTLGMSILSIVQRLSLLRRYDNRQGENSVSIVGRLSTLRSVHLSEVPLYTNTHLSLTVPPAVVSSYAVDPDQCLGFSFIQQDNPPVLLSVNITADPCPNAAWSKDGGPLPASGIAVSDP